MFEAAIAVVLVLFVLLMLVAVQPSDFRMSRAATISAPPEVVFSQVNNFHNWDHWSPWAKLDPNARNAFAGPADGEGAQFSWAGNKEVGEGRMTIIESRPNSLVRIRLEFVKPFEAVNISEFEFAPEGAGTRVTWTMSGTNNFFGKAMCLVMNMDKMVGAQFEKGLQNLNATCLSL